MSPIDGMIRLGVAVAIVALYALGVLSGTLLIVLAVVAVIFIITGFINFCPLYAAFGIRTRKKKA